MIKKAQVSLPTTPINAQNGGDINVQTNQNEVQVTSQIANDLAAQLTNNQFEVGTQQNTPSPIGQQGGNITQGGTSLFNLQVSEAIQGDSKFDTSLEPIGPQDGAEINQANYDAYLQSDYGYNDAEAFSNFWGMDVSEGKLLMGEKLNTGQQSAIDWALSKADVPVDSKFDTKLGPIGPQDGADINQANYDAYLKSDYGYTDAEAFANFWGMDVSEGKLLMGEKLNSGQQSAIDWALSKADIPVDSKFDTKFDPFGPQDGADINQANFDAYVQSDYGYNDAEALSSFWGTDISEAKMLIGQKVSNGQHDAIEWALNKVDIPVDSKFDAKF
jgi:DNA replication initiation complex subunit (GINS family)